MSDGPSNCPRCGGELERQREIVRPVRHESDVALVTVVADVCTRCGENLYHPGMVDRMTAAKRNLEAGSSAPAVGHVYDMRSTG